MTSPRETKPQPPQDREAKLAAALRANLRLRKIGEAKSERPRPRAAEPDEEPR